MSPKKLHKCVCAVCLLVGVFCVVEICKFHILSNTTIPKVELTGPFYKVSKSNNDSFPSKPCKRRTPHKGRRITLNLTIPNWYDLRRQVRSLDSGGRYKPNNCCDPDSVAIIIPFRNRDAHLRIFLQNMHPFLQKQCIEYGIYVVELVTNMTFNRAVLMNIGFTEASKLGDYECFVFHDVDLLPEDDANLYTCPRMPRHMSVAVNTFDYKLPYPEIFGGVSALRKEHFQLVNGYSNLYFGWGGEDDDMFQRIKANGLSVHRYSESIARYSMITHTRDTRNEANPHRKRLLKNYERYQYDGLNTLNYLLLGTLEERVYTKFLVHVDPAHYNVTDFTDPELSDKDITVGLFICVLALVLVFVIYVKEITICYLVRSVKYELSWE